MEMPEGYKELMEVAQSDDESFICRRTVKALKLMKKMAEALEESQDNLWRYVGVKHNHIENILKKFKEWK